MKRYGNLFEKVVTFENLYLAANKAFQGKKTNTNVAPFYFNLENEIIRLREELIGGQYHPRSYGVFEVREPKVRQICSSHFRDRVVHHTVCNILEPIVDRKLIFDTYACRQGKGSHAAVHRARSFVTKGQYFLKGDIKKYFLSIDHATLKQHLRSLFKDRHLLLLLDIIIDHQVPENPPGKGLPIGNLTSQYFANLYLGQLDHFLKDQLAIKYYLRYMDDFIIFDDKKEHLHEILVEIKNYLRQHLQLELKEKATKIAPVTEGVPFLGFRIFKGVVRLQRANLIRFRRKIRKKEAAYRAGWIDEKDLIRSVSSLIAHVNHADSLSVRRKDLEEFLKLA